MDKQRPDDHPDPVDIFGTLTTAVMTLAAVVLGGWLTSRTQERLWARDHARQWRDIRLKAYTDFLGAVRQYVAFVQEPTAKIASVPHPRDPEKLMPFFDKDGLPYKEQLESTRAAVRLVLGSAETEQAARTLIACARQIAAVRSVHEQTAMPPELFDRLWEAQDAFLAAARAELGLDLRLD